MNKLIWKPTEQELTWNEESQAKLTAEDFHIEVLPGCIKGSVELVWQARFITDGVSLQAVNPKPQVALNLLANKVNSLKSILEDASNPVLLKTRKKNHITDFAPGMTVTLAPKYAEVQSWSSNKGEVIKVAQTCVWVKWPYDTCPLTPYTPEELTIVE